MLTIRKAAVIGAGNMGAQIAAHLANVGIPSLLMDVPPTELTPEEQKRGLNLQHPAVRNRLTKTLFERARKLSPAPFFVPEGASLISIGNVEDNLPDLKEADWIIEAVLERMDLKRDLHARIATHARPDALVTSNTSGLSVNGMTQGLPKEHRRRFFGTHFFNPPRYLKLLEVIPTTDTDTKLMDDFTGFAEGVLGKGVVRCKDTTGFIANRIGCFAMQHILWLTVEDGLSFDEVDAITGAPLGRPKSGTYRLGDIVGVDLMVQVGKNFAGELKQDEQVNVFRLPGFIEEMVKRGWWGEKKGQGFYKRVKGEKGSEILTLDYKTMEYGPRQTAPFPSLAALAKLGDSGERLRALCAATDKAGAFAWKHLSAVLCYTANRIPEIADDIVSVDLALKWGYNWELGPFEAWDALGLRETVSRLEKEGRPVPTLVRDLLASGKTSFYETQEGKRLYFDVVQRRHVTTPVAPKAVSLPVLHKNNKVARHNAGASLVDLGDGVACLEFHTKMNVVGAEQMDMWREAMAEVRKNFVGLVIGNQGDHFSAGANLKQLTAQIENQKWKEIEGGIHTFQQATSTLRQFEKPVVVACHGYTLGGGCEISMGADRVVAAAETYMGLPEVGVGLIPAAGGTKEMLIRCTECVPRAEETDYFALLRPAWETVGMAKVSTSALEAAKWKYLRASETTFVLNRDWLLGEAKQKVLQRVAEGYRPRPQRNDIPALGETGWAQFKMILHQMRVAGQISEHDQKIGSKLAYVFCGGDLSYLHFVTEQYILDLEREVFLSLCGEPKTVERIRHTLTTGKPLRN
jgi:3-hydroxyacyl-CoA dehydrogenase